MKFIVCIVSRLKFDGLPRGDEACSEVSSRAAGERPQQQRDTGTAPDMLVLCFESKEVFRKSRRGQRDSGLEAHRH